jgi:hypothetical protein
MLREFFTIAATGLGFGEEGHLKTVSPILTQINNKITNA